MGNNQHSKRNSEDNMSMLKAGRPDATKDKTLDHLIRQKQIHKVSFNMDKGLHKEVRQFALDKEMTISEVIITSLHEYMKK